MATKTNQYEKLKNLYSSELAQAATDNSAQNLWDSLSYGYGKKAEEIGQNYDRAISQQDSSLLRRGMQRSSAGMQSIANLQNQKVKSLGDNTDAMIADWQNRLQQQNEAQAARDFQASEAEKQRAFSTSEREATQLYNTAEREATQRYNTGEREAQQTYSTGEREAQQAWQSGENAANRAQDQAQFEANLGYQRERAAVSDNQWERSFNAQNDQWKQQFDYGKMSDDQKLAYNYVAAIISNGQDPSDDLLARAGLSRADANAMKAQTAEISGGYGGGGGGYSPGNTSTWKNAGFSSEAEYKAALALGVNTPTAYKDKQLQIQSQPDRSPFNPNITKETVQNSKAGQTVKNNILQPASSTTLAKRAASSLVKENKKKSGS